jgi:hypothetical protein
MSHRLEQIISQWDKIVTILDGILGSKGRAYSTAEGMKLEAYYGKCFASTTFLGKRGGISNKAVQRNLNWLDSEGLIDRERRVRPNKTLGTYRIRWDKLWAVVKQLLLEWQRLYHRYGREPSDEQWYTHYDSIAIPANTT